MTLSGIEPATFRFVAQHLNHCATAVPLLPMWENQIVRMHCQKKYLYVFVIPGIFGALNQVLRKTGTEVFEAHATGSVPGKLGRMGSLCKITLSLFASGRTWHEIALCEDSIGKWKAALLVLCPVRGTN